VSLHVWLGFLLAAILIAVTPGPGPGAVASMSAGMRHGYWSALILVLGLQAAILLHLGVVAIGLGALLATSEAAFGLVKLAGAAYLVWLGVQKWRTPFLSKVELLSGERRRSLFLQGLLVNLTNPKAIVFIGALVPSFIDTGAALLPQYLVIAVTLCLTDMLVMSVYALVASRLGAVMRDPKLMRVQNRLFGSLFVTAGTLLALSSRPT